PERSKPGPRETPRTRRARQRAAQDLEDPPQAPLLPLARRSARQGHPRIAGSRGITRMEKVLWMTLGPLSMPESCRRRVRLPVAAVGRSIRPPRRALRKLEDLVAAIAQAAEMREDD